MNCDFKPVLGETALTKLVDHLPDQVPLAFEVYKEMGYGMAEEIYQESLEMELADRGIPFCPKHLLKVYYKGRELKKRYILQDYVPKSKI